MSSPAQAILSLKEEIARQQAAIAEAEARLNGPDLFIPPDFREVSFGKTVVWSADGKKSICIRCWEMETEVCLWKAEETCTHCEWLKLVCGRMFTIPESWEPPEVIVKGGKAIKVPRKEFDMVRFGLENVGEKYEQMLDVCNNLAQHVKRLQEQLQQEQQAGATYRKNLDSLVGVVVAQREVIGGLAARLAAVEQLVLPEAEAEVTAEVGRGRTEGSSGSEGSSEESGSENDMEE